MASQFNPEPYFQAYQAGRNREDERKKNLADSISAIPQSFVQYGQIKQQQAQQQKENDMQRLLLALKAGEQGYDPNAFYGALGGKQPSQAPSQPSMQPNQPTMQPSSSMEQLTQNSIGPWSNPIPSNVSSALTQGSYSNPPSPQMEMPIWKQFAQQNPHLADTHPSTQGMGQQQPAGLFQKPNVDYSQVMKQMGSGDFSGFQNLNPKAQNEVKSLYESDQNRQQREQSRNELSAYQKAMLESNQNKLDATVGTKENQFYQTEWDKIIKETNPLTATSRSGLGLATKADYNANRALVTLSKPVVTNQEAANVMADIASIYQGGSATEYGMSHQAYNTLYGKINGALQQITGEPQNALTPDIKNRLIGVLTDMKSTNKAVMKQHLDYIEKSKAKIISKFPDEWKSIRSGFEGGVAGGPQATGLNQQTQSFNSVDEAEQANLPKGTRIQINGRWATVQ